MKQVPRFNIIIATDSNGGFSYKNKLPWRFLKDSNFYNTITSSNVNYSNNILIMGRKTWDSMRHIVPKNRIVFIITSNCDKYNNEYDENKKKNIYFFPSFEESLINAYKLNDSVIWVVGGYQIYDEALNHPHCASIYHTLIAGDFETDKKIIFNTYNIKWSNVHVETDTNVHDGLNYILYFKKGFIDRHN